MSHTNQTKKIKIYQYSLTVIIILILIISYVVIINGWMVRNYNSKSSGKQSVSESEKTIQKYTSDFLNITLQYPSDYKLEEKTGSIFLSKNSEKIIVDSNGTNYNNLTEYLNYLERINKIQIIDRVHLKINNLNSIKASILFSNFSVPDTYAFFFYPEEWKVISISTESKNLQSDLDAIAQSFSYSP